jgi:ABC-type amino acid transport substrate-binding protein
MTNTTLRRAPRSGQIAFVVPLLSLFLLVVFALGLTGTARAQTGGGALEAIRRRGELLIATDATYPPF